MPRGIWKLLLNDSPNTRCTSITHHPSGPTTIPNLQQRSRAQTLLQLVKSLLLLCSPIKHNTFPSQHSDGFSNLGKTINKPPIVIGQTQKLLHLIDSSGSWPLFNSFHFTRFNHQTIWSNPVSKKFNTLQKQSTLAFFQPKVKLLQNTEYLPQMLPMLLQISTIY